MKLDRLTVENFRQYYGRQEIAFSRSPKKPVTVVHGINGAGKTSMFTALNWCLYGREVVDNIGELVCKRAIVDVPPGQLVRSSVELSFTHAGQRYIMERRLGVVRQLDGQIHAYENEAVTLDRIDADGQAKEENSPLSTINAILPANIRSYFLFDGEKIDDFAKPEAASEVKDAIYLVLRLEVLDRARQHLKQMVRQYRKEAAALSDDDEIKKLNAEIEAAEGERDATKERLAQVEKEIASAENHIATIDARLVGMESVGQLQKDRKKAETDLKKERKALETCVSDIQTQASRSYLLMAQPILDEALAVLDDKRQKGQIPSNIRQQFIQDLLNELQCICGRPIQEHADEYTRLQTMMQRAVSSELENAVLDANTALHGLKREGQLVAEKLDGHMHDHVATLERIKQLDGSLADLELQLKDAPEEDVGKLEDQRRQYKQDVERNRVQIGRLQERIATKEQTIEQLSTQIQRAQKSNARLNRILNKQTLAQQAAQAIDDTYDRHADMMRRDIEARTNDIFRQLVWKGSHFDAIRLDEKYNLEVIDRYGMAARPELSAGERQVLSLSFITAMAQVSGEEAPLVMDTPFGRLSSHHRNSITANLPQLSTQLILFVTDQEFNEQMRDNLTGHIGAEYNLNFDRAASMTTIEVI